MGEGGAYGCSPEGTTPSFNRHAYLTVSTATAQFDPMRAHLQSADPPPSPPSPGAAMEGKNNLNEDNTRLLPTETGGR